MLSPTLSIIIVNWNTKDLLEQCLDSLTGSGKPTIGQVEVILVDNGSTDGSVNLIYAYERKYQTKDLKIKAILNRENLGFAKANNQAIKLAQGRYVMLLNSDTIVQPEAIDQLTNYLDQHPKTAVVGPKLLNPDKTGQPNCGLFPNLAVVFVMLFLERHFFSRFVRYVPVKSQSVDWLMGAAVIFRRKIIETVGGFDENIFMYMDEVDWFYRIAQKKYLVEAFPVASIVHLGRGSSKSGKKEPILNIYRGLIYFYKKHYSKVALIFLLAMLKLKALAAYAVGIIFSNRYLRETYGKAFWIN